MGKLKGYKKPLSSFFTWTKEEQAQFIEKETKNVIKRLPKLKAALQMYGEVSDELYNMSSEELGLMGSTYSRAIRGGEISTPSSQASYKRFINSLKRYSRVSIRQLAVETAQQRMDSWLEHVKANGTEEEIEYAIQMVESMSDDEKIGFTKSKYFLDTENWNSQSTFEQTTDDGIYSIQVLKLELYLEEKGHTDLKHIYLKQVANGKTIEQLRKYHKPK